MARPALRLLAAAVLCLAVFLGVNEQIFSEAGKGGGATSCNKRAKDSFLSRADDEDDSDLNSMGMEDTVKWMHDLMEPERIKENLRYFTSVSHIGGTPEDLKQAAYIRDVWKGQQLDDVVLNQYNVLLSYPNLTQPSRVHLLDDKGDVKFTSSIFEDVANEPTGEFPAYLAFCPSGEITKRELVYANYGRKEDFKLLEKLGISVEGKLVIMRYGAMFRGNKIKNAQEFGAIGTILYTDPADYDDPESSSDPYPSSFWLPDSGIQRGVVTWLDGDPLTYGYPATEEAFRDGRQTPANMPLGPCHTLSARDAHKLLTHLGGPEAPAAWRGRLNTTYRLGPQLARRDWSVRLTVRNREEVAPTYNVLGFIRGAVEPDRYVILGNHRDAWVYGSLDPCSGTAAMMEMVRAFSVMKQSGWRPRRTLVFASWGSGEYGYYGAIELIEEYIHLLGGRTVAYLNVDLAIIYTYNLLVVATPLMHQPTVQAAKLVAAPDPSLGFSTLYDHWRGREKRDLFSYNLGSPSEHMAFYQLLGTPILYTIWEIDYDRWGWNDYPLYHTAYETLEAMDFLDPEYVYHLALGRLWGAVALITAHSALLPMDVRDVARPLRHGLAEIHNKYGQQLLNYNISTAGLEKAVQRYERISSKFYREITSRTHYTNLELRQLNDQIVGVEKAFIDPNGLMVDKQNRNAVFGTDPEHEYNGSIFPDVVDTLIEAAELADSEAALLRVRRALAAAIFVVNAAAASLQPPGSFLHDTDTVVELR